MRVIQERTIAQYFFYNLNILTLFIESTAEETMENFCIIASSHGHIDFDDEENVHFLRNIYFTKFISHDQKINISKRAKNPIFEEKDESSDSEDIPLERHKKHDQRINSASLPFIQPPQQSPLMLFQNPSFFPYNQGFYPMISTNDYPFQQSFPQQSNQYFNNQGNSQEHKILEAIQSLEKKFEDKIFRVEQNQNHLNNVVDGLVSDVVDLKKKERGKPNTDGRRRGSNRGGRGGRGGGGSRGNSRN